MTAFWNAAPLIKALEVDANFLFQDCFPQTTTLSFEAKEVARAFDLADKHQKDTVRLVLGLTEVVDNHKAKQNENDQSTKVVLQPPENITQIRQNAESMSEIMKKKVNDPIGK